MRAGLAGAFVFVVDERREDRGVTDVIVGFRVPYVKGPDSEPLQKKIDHLNWFADNIIHKVGS